MQLNITDTWPWFPFKNSGNGISGSDVSIIVELDAPLSRPFNLLLVKHPKLNIGFSAQHARTPERSTHLYIRNGGGVVLGHIEEVEMGNRIGGACDPIPLLWWMSLQPQRAQEQQKRAHVTAVSLSQHHLWPQGTSNSGGKVHPSTHSSAHTPAPAPNL